MDYYNYRPTLKDHVIFYLLILLVIPLALIFIILRLLHVISLETFERFTTQDGDVKHYVMSFFKH